MPIINCPECGEKVSDKADKCIHCGAPLKFDKKVKIKCGVFPTVFMGARSKVTITVDGKEVFSGGLREEVAVFEIDQPTKATFWVQRWKDKMFVYDIEPGKRYQFIPKVSKAALGMEPHFQEVDVIDSD